MPTIVEQTWLGRALRVALVVGLLCVTAGRLAYGSVGVVLNESLHESMDRITGTGHTAVYFSNICAESPVKLRLCRPGETGSVISTYINIGEDYPYGWNIVPLSIYLYGVEDPVDRPLFGSYKVKRLLEDRYRDNYLREHCASDACRTGNKAEWREMVAATMIRGVYIFAVDTTEEQDRAFVGEFNQAANKRDFNGLTNNCADFTKHIINTYFPGAVRRDLLNDFGMTSPKAVARTFTHYALQHPESNFRAMHFAQVPGTIPRSSEVRAGTEQLYRSKKWLVPMLVFANHELPFAAASYLLVGRFSPEGTFEKYAVPEPGDESPSDLGLQLRQANAMQRAEFVGTASEWRESQKRFDALVDQAQSGLERGPLTHLFKQFDRQGSASVDADGSLWMEYRENGELLKLGLSANNVISGNSNRRLAYEFLAARSQWELKSAKYRRETMRDFQEDWNNLQRAGGSVETTTTLKDGVSPAKSVMALKTVTGND
jgi:hypothetical protein